MVIHIKLTLIRRIVISKHTATNSIVLEFIISLEILGIQFLNATDLNEWKVSAKRTWTKIDKEN
jgi:hypothetical protein